MEVLSLNVNPEDISSYANFDKILQTNIAIDAYFDISKKTISGVVDITFTVLDPDENRVILDCQGYSISTVTDKLTGQELKWSFYKENPYKEALGTPLVIFLESEVSKKRSTVELSIAFTADETCAAIKFLEPEQTLNKKYPFMFTQSEPILARTMLPCQDSPSAKVTVQAKVTVDSPLTALFSGIEVRHYQSTSDPNKITFEYEQKIPLATYLISFAVGELEFGKISDRCGVWTEVGLLEKALYEFEDTEMYLKTAEEYLGPYQWGAYNILVLPPSFPYGGMENPCLTFVTPALIAGDKSMCNVIAHEIAHSWTGNLVTNKDWANFWINEGFTTFMERKISELINGEDIANLEARVGKGELAYAIQAMGESHSYTTLNPDFSNANPDDGFSEVPYEKGYTFLYYLEQLTGKSNWQKILQNWVKTYTLKSVSYLEFKKMFEEMVCEFFGEKAEEEVLSKIDWEAWIFHPGQPVITFEYKTKWIGEAYELAEKFLTGNVDNSDRDAFINWHTNVKLVFLNYLEQNINRITDESYVKLRDILGLHKKYNAETKYVWYQIALNTHHDDVIEDVKDFLLTNGRMKYLKPVYFAWCAFQKESAVDFFNKNKRIYHNVPSRIIEEKFSAISNE